MHHTSHTENSKSQTGTLHQQSDYCIYTLQKSVDYHETSAHANVIYVIVSRLSIQSIRKHLSYNQKLA